MNDDTTDRWKNASDAKKMLGGTGCELMHLRESGRLRFQKRGNAYFYDRYDLAREFDTKRNQNSSAH